MKVLQFFLKKLETVEGNLPIAISTLRTENELYAVFTDKDYSECFGIIY